MGIKTKSLIISSMVFIGAFVSFNVWNTFYNGVTPDLSESVPYMLFAGIVDFILVFLVSYGILKWSGTK